VLTPELQAWAAGFPLALLHAAAALAMLAGGAIVYSLITPHKEIRLIRDGNLAAGISFGALLAALAIPLAAVLAASASLTDIAIWGAGTLVLQLAVFRLTDLLLHDLPLRIARGETAAAAVLAGAKIGSALLLAAAVGPQTAG
jgi:putative membrane protein